MPKPRGLAKTGGRQPGSPNKVSTVLRDAAQKYTPAALQVLQNIMCNAKNPAAARVAAAAELLNRGHGRPMQQIEAHNLNENRYAVVPEKMSDPEWKKYLEYKQATALPAQSAARKEQLAPPNAAQTNGTAPKLN